MTALIKDQIVEFRGRRWRIKEAVSMAKAEEAMVDACISGSVGASLIRDERFIGGGQVIEADVVQINSDGSERQPYIEPY